MVFVTHGIEESIYLSDRVVVMTYRPGTVKRIVEVRLPRPRDPASPEFNRLERELTALVMAEEARHQADEDQDAAVRDANDSSVAKVRHWARAAN